MSNRPCKLPLHDCHDTCGAVAWKAQHKPAGQIMKLSRATHPHVTSALPRRALPALCPSSAQTCGKCAGIETNNHLKNHASRELNHSTSTVYRTTDLPASNTLAVHNHRCTPKVKCSMTTSALKAARCSSTLSLHQFTAHLLMESTMGPPLATKPASSVPSAAFQPADAASRAACSHGS